MNERLLAVFVLLLLLGPHAYSQDANENSSAPSSNATSSPPGVILVESTPDLERLEAIRKVVDALEKDGIAKKVPHYAPSTRRGLTFNAQVTAKPDASFDSVYKVVSMLKELNVPRVTFRTANADSGFDRDNEVLITCLPDVSYLKVTELKEVMNSQLDFKVKVIVALPASTANRSVLPTSPGPTLPTSVYTPADSPSTGSANVPDGGTVRLGGVKPLAVAELRTTFEAREQHSREIAAKLRGSLKVSSEADALRKKLRESVEQAFAARQELQRAELDQFAKRVENLQQSLERSDRFSEKIIDRRVEELLDPDLKWYAPKPLANSATSAATGSDPPITNASNAEATPNNSATSPEELLAIEKGALQGDWIATAAVANGKPEPSERLANIRVKFAGHEMTFSKPEPGARPSEWKFEVDASKKPMTIAFSPVPGEETAQPGPAIYALDGDTLTLCFGETGKEPPTKFAAPEGSGIIMLTLKRKLTPIESTKAKPDQPKELEEQAPVKALSVEIGAQQGASIELLSPFELRLAYVEPGADRAERTIPGTEHKVYVATEPFASISDVSAAQAIEDASGQPAIEITFAPDSAKRIEKITQQHLNKPLAILVDGKLLSAPTIRERIGSAAVITGRFSREETERIAQTIRTATKADLAQSVSDSDAGPVWGEAVDGLQLAVSGIRQDRHFKSGDTIRFRLHVRNVRTEAIRFQYKPSELCYWIAPLVEKANGERVEIRQMFFRGGHSTYTGTLEPNANVPIHVSGILVLGASETAEKTWPRIEKPEPGEYRLHGRYRLQRLDADGKEIIERDADGKRIVSTSDLTSGTVTFRID